MLAWIEILRARSSTPIQGQRPVQWVLSRQIQPVAFYAYLKSRFGDPNGFAMMLREPSVDNLIHWNFTLISGDTYLDISCLNTRMEIVLTGPFDGSVDELEKMLLEEFTRHKKAIAETKRGFERWHLFINPFARLKRLTDQQLERLTELDIPGLAVPHLDEAIHDAQSFHSKMKEVTTKCDEAMALTITLQMAAPILGESLVNFLILLLAKPEIRCDERMLDSYTRQNIDVRIKSLPVICTGFQSNIDFTAEPYKNFLRLMDSRNKRLHGNIDPKTKTGDEIYFDHRFIPLFEFQRSIPEFAVHAALAHSDPTNAIEDVKTARDFIAFLLDQLQPAARKQIDMILDTPQLGYRPDKRMVGVILPPHYVDMIMAPESPPDDGPNRVRTALSGHPPHTT